jgi:hypothetical protein
VTLFFAFGVDMGNLRKDVMPRARMQELIRRWNKQLASAESGSLEFLEFYRHTGNFLFEAHGNAQLERVAEVLAQTEALPVFAVFPKDEFLSCLGLLHKALLQTPGTQPGRRWTPGLVMDVSPKGGIPPTPFSDEKAVFGALGLPRVRVAWKGDILANNGQTLDKTKREGGWGALSDRMKQAAGGMWTARSISSIEGLVYNQHT